MTNSPPARVLVIGAGLIGASIGLALRDKGSDVVLDDASPDRARLAADLGAGRVAASDEATSAAAFDVAMVCVPPEATAGVLLGLQSHEVAATYSDVASIKQLPQRQIESLGGQIDRFVGGHPIAGRERGGPAAARADLFLGRPWVLTPTAATAADAVAAIRRLVEACGAVPVVVDAAEHDAAVALVSHAPQVLASLLAAQLVEAGPTAIGLGGAGLRDLTRIADSDPDLWAQIAAGNAGPLGTVLRTLAAELDRLAEGLAAAASDPDGAAAGLAAEAVQALIASGNAGRARLPGKHGARATPFVTVPVVIDDEPGVLARLLADVGAAGVNVEDLALEHSPGAPVGTCELAVRPEQAARLAEALAEHGWAVHASA